MKLPPFTITYAGALEQDADAYELVMAFHVDGKLEKHAIKVKKSEIQDEGDLVPSLWPLMQMWLEEKFADAAADKPGSKKAS